MEITLGQQYNNVGEKPTVILYTYINRHAGTPEKQLKQNRNDINSTPSNMVVIIYYYIGYKYKATKWHLTGSPIMVVTLGQQYNVGEKPTVIRYTYINHHAEPPNIIKHKTLWYIVKRIIVLKNDNSTIEPYKNRGLGKQYNVGQNHPVLYCTIPLNAMQGYQTKTEDTTSLDYNSICYVTSRIGWASMKGIFKYRCRRDSGKLSNNSCYTYLTKDQHPPSRANLLVYSTIQYSTI